MRGTEKVVKDKRELRIMVPLPEADGGEAIRRRGQVTIIDAAPEHNNIRSRLMAHFICAGTVAVVPRRKAALSRTN